MGTVPHNDDMLEYFKIMWYNSKTIKQGLKSCEFKTSSANICDWKNDGDVKQIEKYDEIKYDNNIA